MSPLDVPTFPESSPILLRNPFRFWVPLLTFAAILVMFAPPIALGFRSSGATLATIAGTVIFVLSAASLLRSAYRAPVSLTLDGDALLIGRPRRIDRFDASRIKRWTFSLPDGPPARSAPGTNAMLVITFDEGTTFRGEVTREEGRDVASWLARNRRA